ncbi:MAG: hypothetical protein J6Y03_05785 [Alphaproteobacteria bacterium]|nr:hypothetical protein [Alphaproteobacteria bacterium]
MKRRTFLLFFTCLFLGSSVFAQSTDLPLFEEEKKAEPCPTCTKKKNPIIGNDVKPVESIYFAPPPFPAVNIKAPEETLSPKPFEGMNLAYESKYVDTSEYSNKLSAPVDFSGVKETPSETKIQIKKAEDDKDKEQKGVKQTEKNAPEEPKKDVEKKVEASAEPTAQKRPSLTPFSSGVSANVGGFDIADLQLGMSPEDVIDSAADNGFEVTNVAYGIPSFMVTNFERDCRESGLYQLRLIHECVRERARDEDVYYISQLVLKKEITKEQIVVLFSSTLTDNQAFKIDYTGFGDNSLSTSYKDLLKKTNRRDVFWKYVSDKYGRPRGNDGSLFWGNQNGVLMRVFMEGNAMDGRIILEDVTQRGTDYRQAEDWNKEQEISNPFSF